MNGTNDSIFTTFVWMLTFFSGALLTRLLWLIYEKEKMQEQKEIIGMSSLIFGLIFIISLFDSRLVIIIVSYVVFVSTVVIVFYWSGKEKAQISQIRETKLREILEAYKKIEYYIARYYEDLKDEITLGETINLIKGLCKGVGGAFCSKDVLILVENLTERNFEENVHKLKIQMREEIEKLK